MRRLDDFSGRYALITGGASGIGLASAQEFLERGAAVAILDVDTTKLGQVVDVLADRFGAGSVRAFPIDLVDREQVAAAIESLRSEWGRVDHLVNAAASFIAGGSATSSADWQRSLDVNVVAPAMLTSGVVALMGPGSTVVNVSSISAHAAQPNRWTYNAGKAAVLALTRGQALDFAPRGVRVNAVSPGWIWTAEVAKAAGDDREKWEPVWGEYHILGRLGEAREVAAAVAFLSSAEASFITGTELFVDGGYSALGPEGRGNTSRFAGSDGDGR